MANQKELFATHASDKTPLIIGDVEIPAYVLSNGMRVFSQNGIQKAIGYMGTAGNWLTNFVNRKQLKPHFSSGVLTSLTNRVEFKRNNAGGSASITYGYDATILIDICDAIIEAKNSGNLSEKNIEYANRAELIIRAVAKVGIIALVDEATGYQYDREARELQKILKAYISQELLPWQKRFPDIFYKEIFRLKGWDYTVNGIKNRPSVIGTWTNNLIYKKLPKGVLKQLKEETPKNEKGKRKHRFHQLLTLDIGHADLQRQLTSVITIMQLSKNWNEFEKSFNQLYGQTAFDFGEEIKEVKKQEPLSDFDKKLKKGLNYNPKEEK